MKAKPNPNRPRWSGTELDNDINTATHVIDLTKAKRNDRGQWLYWSTLSGHWVICSDQKYADAEALAI